MKTNRIIKNLAALALLSAFSLQPLALQGQGSLTPPGQPAPTMKSADQIYSKLDPRTPISSAPFIITNSGSYYLTTNLTVGSGDAIDINTNGVTLDLNGFTIFSTASSPAGSAIGLNSGLSDITIVNGHIRSGVTNNGSGYGGTGFFNGIINSLTAPANTVISKVSVSGVGNHGICLGGGNPTVLVEDCTVTTAGNIGIYASIIKNSVATDCGYMAIGGDHVADCRGIVSSNGLPGFGVYASATAQNCYGQNASYNSGSYGLYAYKSAQNCSGYASSGTGLFSLVASGCFGSSTSGTGLQATIAVACIIDSGTANITYYYNMPPP